MRIISGGDDGSRRHRDGKRKREIQTHHILFTSTECTTSKDSQLKECATCLLRGHLEIIETHTTI